MLLAPYASGAAILGEYRTLLLNNNNAPVGASVPSPQGLYDANMAKVVARVSIVAGIVTVSALSFGVASATYSTVAGFSSIQLVMHNNWAVGAEYKLFVTSIGVPIRMNTSPGSFYPVIMQTPTPLTTTVAFRVVDQITNAEDDPFLVAGGNASAVFAVTAYGAQA